MAWYQIQSGSYRRIFPYHRRNWKVCVVVMFVVAVSHLAGNKFPAIVIWTDLLQQKRSRSYCSVILVMVFQFQFQLQLWFFSYSFSYSYVVFLFIFQLSYRYSYRFSVYISVITFSSFSYSFIVTLHEICISVCKENTIATLVLRFYYTARKMGKNPAETKD